MLASAKKKKKSHSKEREHVNVLKISKGYNNSEASRNNLKARIETEGKRNNGIMMK